MSRVFLISLLIFLSACKNSVVNISDVNSAPLVQDINIEIAEDSTYEGRIIASDSDNDKLTYTIGPLESPNGQITLSDNNSGEFVYVPNENFSGNDEYQFGVSDGYNTLATARIMITVTPVNDAPIASAGQFSLNMNATLDGELAGMDVEADLLTYSIVENSRSGSFSLDSDSGSFSYTSDSDFSGKDSITFQVSDGEKTSEVAQIDFFVVPMPTLDEVAEDTEFTTQLPGYLSDTLRFSLIEEPKNGQLTLKNAITGAISFAPNENFNGQDSFTYRWTDGKFSSDPITVNVSVQAVQDAPVAESTQFIADVGQLLNDIVTASDADNHTLTYELVDPPTQGTASLNSESGEFTYQSNADAVNEDSFTFRVNDGVEDSETATVSFLFDPAIISFSTISFSEGGSTNTVSIPITLSKSSSVPISFDYTLQDGTAIDTVDYEANSGTVTINPGETTANIDFTLIGDTLDDANKTIELVLTNPSNGYLESAQLTLTIMDDDNPPTIQFNTASTSTDEAAKTITFSVGLSEASARDITVLVSVNGSAASGSDYTAYTTTSFSIPAGSTSVSDSISILTDSVSEGAETIVLTLATPQNATLGTNTQYTITINGNLEIGQLTVETESNNSMLEADPLTQNLSISGQLSNNTDQDWFYTTVTSGSNLSIRFDTSSIADYEWKVSVLDPSGAVLTSQDSDNGLVVSAGITSPGTYYVMVEKRFTSASSDQYSLTLLDSGSSVDIFETENNNSQNSADLLSVGVITKAQLSSNSDQDWFYTTVTSGSSLSIRFDTSSTADYEWKVSVLDSSGAVLTSQDSDNELVVSAGITSPGTYYVMVEKRFTSASSDQYSLTLLDSGSSVDIFETENNNSQNSADLLSVGVTTKAQLSSNSDQDWFYTTVTSGSSLSIRFDTSSTADYEWKVSVLDPSGAVLTSQDSDNGLVVSAGITSPGTYYVMVEKRFISASSDRYSLTRTN